MNDVLRLALPMTLWLVCFSAIYGLHGVICATELSAEADPGWGGLALTVGWVVAVVLQAVVLGLLWTDRFGGPPGLVRRLARMLAVVGLVAAVWTFTPIAIVPVCDGLGLHNPL